MVGVFLKYIGPFLRMNTLNPSNIHSQMNFLAKESLQNIILHSNCGICMPFSELKLKHDLLTLKILALAHLYCVSIKKLTLNL